jgi:hypothetical protein
MILCQILYVSDKKDDKEKVIKEKVKKNKFDIEKVKMVEKCSANELGEKLKQIGFEVGEVCENVGFDETLKAVNEKMFSVSEVISVLKFVQCYFSHVKT